MRLLPLVFIFNGCIATCFMDHDPLAESCAWRMFKCAPLCLTPFAPAQSCETENYGCRDEGYAKKIRDEYEKSNAERLANEQKK